MKKFSKQINGQLNETSKSIARAVNNAKLEETEKNKVKTKDKPVVCVCKAKNE